jgi:hypothetical protein
MGTERRWGARKPIEVDVVIDNQPLCLLHGRIGNISIGGLFVETASVGLHTNSKVELVLLLQEQGGTRVYRMPALVVRVAGNGAGFMFDEYDVNAFRTLVALVLDRQKRAADLAPRGTENAVLPGRPSGPDRGDAEAIAAGSVTEPPHRGESTN